MEEGKINKLVIESLAIAEEKYKNDPILRDFEKANKEFNQLVAKGITKRRGNNLFSIVNNDFKNQTFNVPFI